MANDLKMIDGTKLGALTGRAAASLSRDLSHAIRQAAESPLPAPPASAESEAARLNTAMLALPGRIEQSGAVLLASNAIVHDANHRSTQHTDSDAERYHRTLDLDNGTLSDNVHSVHLSPQQCQFLAILARASERYTAYDILIYQLWPVIQPLAPLKFIKVLMCTTRSRLHEAGISLDIVTHWGKGYTLKSPIEVISHEQVITISVTLAREIRRLLDSHPDRRAADAALAVMVVP